MLTTYPNRVSASFADPFRTMFRELDREFPWGSTGNGISARHAAPLSMWEDGSAIYVDVDIPGIALDDLDVSLEKGRLTIRGERKVGERPAGLMHDERFFGQFERTIVLNEWVDPKAIEAAVRDGVLHLKFSKKPESQRQKITVNAGTGPEAQRIETTA